MLMIKSSKKDIKFLEINRTLSFFNMMIKQNLITRLSIKGERDTMFLKII